jgi:hypothetical protein
MGTSRLETGPAPFDHLVFHVEQQDFRAILHERVTSRDMRKG